MLGNCRAEEILQPGSQRPLSNLTHYFNPNSWICHCWANENLLGEPKGNGLAWNSSREGDVFEPTQE
jgi:hypothetical protein